MARWPVRKRRTYEVRTDQASLGVPCRAGCRGRRAAGRDWKPAADGDQKRCRGAMPEPLRRSSRRLSGPFSGPSSNRVVMSWWDVGSCRRRPSNPSAGSPAHRRGPEPSPSTPRGRLICASSTHRLRLIRASSMHHHPATSPGRTPPQRLQRPGDPRPRPVGHGRKEPDTRSSDAAGSAAAGLSHPSPQTRAATSAGARRA